MDAMPPAPEHRTTLPPGPSTPPPPLPWTPPRSSASTHLPDPKSTPSCCTPAAESPPEAQVFRHGW